MTEPVRPIELGLVGSGIERSMAPTLHRLLGRLTGRPVEYALHDIPPNRFDDVLALLTRLEHDGVTGVNVTHPFKESVVRLVMVPDPHTAAIGAVNTIRFAGPDGPTGHNTDHSGFVRAYRARFGDAPPGVVAQLGAGGVGRAVAFALASLGASEIRLYDPDERRTQRLIADLGRTGVTVAGHPTPEQSLESSIGAVNCSPVGMHSHPGCPVDPSRLTGVRWLFDAVYSPTRTEFLAAGEAHGAHALQGTELFFWQGIDAYEIFHGTSLDAATIQVAAKNIDAEFAMRAKTGA